MNIKPAWIPNLLITGLYAASYTLWYQLLGAGFKGYNLLDFSHYLNPAWLADDMAGSLLYLHAQPPLMNLIIGLIFTFIPEYHEAAFRSLYFIGGLVAWMAIYHALALLSIRPLIRWLALTCLAITPTFYMFATWYGTTHLEFCLSSLMLYGMVHFCCVPQKRLRLLTAIFICFALLGLIRPQWHLGLFVVLAGGFMTIGRQRLIKPAMLLSLIFILPIGGWYGKNLVMFGFFGGSSWLGANLSQVAVKSSTNELDAMKLAGLISPDFPGDFLMINILDRIPPALLEGEQLHPALGAIKTDNPDFLEYAKRLNAHYAYYNMNYIGVIPSARQDLKDSLTIIKARPIAYLETVLKTFLSSSSIPAMMHYSVNLLYLRDYASWLQAHQGIFYALLASAFLFYALIPAATFFLLPSMPPTTRQALLLCLGLTIFMVFTSCALNGWEQERMRWAWQGVYVIFMAVTCDKIASLTRRK